MIAFMAAPSIHDRGQEGATRLGIEPAAHQREDRLLVDAAVPFGAERAGEAVRLASDVDNLQVVERGLHLVELRRVELFAFGQPFGFVALPDSLSTGSSIMPQKKNPDAAELVRGHAGRIAGCLTALMITMKGLPLAYSKDMQDDKPPVFEAAGLLGLSIAAMSGMVEGCEFRTERMRQAAELGYATATDLADWLVREAGVPFREAHHVTGAAVRLAESRGIALEALPLAELQAIDARIGEGVYQALSVEASVAARASHGGTAPAEVRKRIAEAREALGMQS